MPNFLLPMIEQADRVFQLRNARNGQVVARTLIPAFNSDARRKGLLGRDSLPEGAAMIIAPTNAIHTFWMRFAIDVVFVRRNGVVVKVHERLSPWRAAIGVRAYAAIELPTGTARRTDVRVGDVMSLTASSDQMDERSELGRLFDVDSIDGRRQVPGEQRV